MSKFLDAEYMANMLELQDDAHFANSIRRLAEQRDALLAALEAAVEWAMPMQAAPRDARPAWFDQSRAAISKVKADLL